MCNNDSWTKIMFTTNSWKIWTRTSGKGGGFGNSDAPGQGRGWFKNPRFWRTSFIDGPLPIKCLYVRSCASFTACGL